MKDILFQRLFQVSLLGIGGFFLLRQQEKYENIRMENQKRQFEELFEKQERFYDELERKIVVNKHYKVVK